MIHADTHLTAENYTHNTENACAFIFFFSIYGRYFMVCMIIFNVTFDLALEFFFSQLDIALLDKQRIKSKLENFAIPHLKLTKYASRKHFQSTVCCEPFNAPKYYYIQLNCITRAREYFFFLLYVNDIFVFYKYFWFLFDFTDFILKWLSKWGHFMWTKPNLFSISLNNTW